MRSSAWSRSTAFFHRGGAALLEEATRSTTSDRIAIYWDFENLAISQYDHVHGRSAWRTSSRADRITRLSNAKLAVDVILEHAMSLGTVVVNRAYCDRSRSEFADYGDELAKQDVQLVQQFSSDTGKNGADIRIALDVAETLRIRADVTGVLLCSGDSDFLPLVELCLRNGRGIHAVGINTSTSELWRRSCDFVSYQTLTQPGAATDLAGTRLRHSAGSSPVAALREALQLVPQGRWVDIEDVAPLIRYADWGIDVGATGVAGAQAVVDAAAAGGEVEVDRRNGTPRRVRKVPPSDPPGVVRSKDSRPVPVAVESDTVRPSGRVAVYWDLEGLVAAEYDRVHGHGRWASDRVDGRWIPQVLKSKVSDARIDVRAPMRLAATLGAVAINRVFADWTRQIHRNYHGGLANAAATDFVQVHKHRRALRTQALPMTVLADVQRTPAITDVMLCCGTVGFDDLAEMCRAAGVRLHVVGTRRSSPTGRPPDTFTSYEQLIPARRVAPLPLWAGILRDSLHSGDPVGAGALKTAMRERDIAFDEKALGFPRFWEFLKAAEQLGLVLLDDRGGADKWVRAAEPAATDAGTRWGIGAHHDSVDDSKDGT